MHPDLFKEKLIQLRPEKMVNKQENTTAWKVAAFGVILVGIFPHFPADQNNSEYGHFLRSAR